MKSTNATHQESRSLSRKPVCFLATVALTTLAAMNASAVTPRSYTGSPITENFDDLGSSGTVIGPLVGWDAGNFNPLQGNQPGPGNGITTVTDTSLVVDDGTIFLANNTASIGNLGTGGSSDRALGGMPKTASQDLYHQVAIQNDSGSPIASFDLSYTGEQWASASSTNPDSLTVWFSDNNATSGFVTMGGAFTFTAPKLNLNSKLDGNAAANRTVISGNFTPATPIAAGNTIYIRWYDRNDGAQDHVLAIDDFTFAKAAPAANILTFGLPGNPAVITGTNIYLTVPDGTNVTALAPTFTMSYGASCTHGVTGDPIVSGVTPVDFTSPVHYIVTSSDSAIIKDYTVQVNFQPVITTVTTALNVTAAATGAEILNDAALVEANHFYGGTGAPVTLANGLTFGTSYAHTTPAGWSGGQNTNTDAHAHVPLLTDATPFGYLMRRYTWSSVSTHTMTVPGLTPGHTYRLQLISGHDTRALVSVEGTANVTWSGANTVFRATWIQSPGDTELNVVLTRNVSNGNAELETNGYALHDLSVLPVAPTGLAATPLVGEIRLNWTPAAGVAYYNVKRALAPGGPYPPESVIGTPTGPPFSDTSVSNGTTYYYVVSSVNIAGESVTNSDEVSSSPTVTKADQSITFALGLSVTKTVDDSAFADVASATSILPVTYSVHPADAAVASVDPVTGMVTILRVPGTARILADQAGNAAFNPAPQVEQLLTVNQVMPVLTWATPRAIVDGTALSATQLNATCTVPGTFSYTPASGEVLAVGSHTLSVHFAPDEPVPYGTPADKTVTLTVGTPAGPTVINVNYGLASNATMNGIYSFDPVASGSASQPAPAAYGGNTWNDFGGDTGSANLLDSFGTGTGIGFSWGPGAVSSPYNDWNGLGFNRLLISGRFLNSSTYAAVFTLTGLNAAHKYDLYIASLHNTEQNSIDFQTVGAATSSLHCQYVNATGWVAGQDYVHFTDLVPAADGTLVVNAQRPGSGYLNGFQLIDLGSDSDYNTWTTMYPGFTDTDPTHDPDHDGMTNQEEYAFGLDPTKGSSVSPMIGPIDKTTGMFKYTRRATPAATGLNYSVWTSTNLAGWTKDDGANQTVESTSDGVETVVVTLTGAPLTAPKLFIRVTAE